jgi:thymidine kinase
MFSGKTSELIRLVEREAFAKKKAGIFKPSFDRRYSVKEVATHNGLRYDAYSLAATEDEVLTIPELVRNNSLDVIGFDEVQFFPSQIIAICEKLAYEKRVIVCGLNLSFRAEPFETTMQLAARADNVKYLSAVCVVCGREGTRTQRLIDGQPAPRDSPTIVVGGKELYEPRCRTCYVAPV